MDLDQLDLNPRIMAAVRKVPVTSLRQLLHFSGPDLQRATGLTAADIRLLLQAAASHLRGPSVVTALQLYQQKEWFPSQHQRLSLGCPVLDWLVGGGLPLQGITELAGRSSTGKTQLALQLCLAVQLPPRHGGLEAGAVFVSTEDAFPSRRLQQLIGQQQQLRTDVPADVLGRIPFGDRIFVEHVADVDSLLQCVTTKVPVLLARGLVRLLVIDSVAAPFRCEFPGPDAAPRARLLQALGAALRQLSYTHGSPVLCINQVSEAMDEQNTAGSAGNSRVLPALGVAWANQLLMRLMADRQREDQGPGAPPSRTLRVVFAPHLPPAACSYSILTEGVRGMARLAHP